MGVKTLYIEPFSPWENGYCASLRPKLRDELLNVQFFLHKAPQSSDPHRSPAVPLQCCASKLSSLGYEPSATEASLPPTPGFALLCASASPDACWASAAKF